jgi:hypothetical protein
MRIVSAGVSFFWVVSFFSDVSFFSSEEGCWANKSEEKTVERTMHNKMIKILSIGSPPLFIFPSPFPVR